MNVLHRLALVSLLALAAGCGNVETGAGTKPPAGDDDDDDGGNGSTPTPAPTTTPGGGTPGSGEVPETLGGWFSIGNIRSHGNDPPAGLGGSGFFSATSIPLFWKEPWEALFGGYPAMALDTCGWGYGASIAIGGSGQVSYSAGDLTLASPVGSGSFFFLPLGGLQIYIAQSMAGVFEPAGAQYTLSGTGDQVGAFSVTFAGPPDVRVTHPDLTATTPVVLDRTQDFPLKWEAHDDGQPLFVFLLYTESEGAASQVVVCKLEDDGDGVIPASAMQMLPEPAWGSEQALQILKYRVLTFEAPGATGPVLLNFSSGYVLPASIE